MSFTKPTILALATLLFGAAAAAPSPEVADLAARITFGYYDGDARVVEAAHDELVRLGDADSDVRYERALAALRLAQLRAEHGQPLGTWPAECAAAARPGEATGAAAESWLLVAACSQVAGRGEAGAAPARDRRREQAFARARELDAGNPRLALLEALEISDRPALAAPAAQSAAAEKLRAALAAFAAREAPPGAPDWGQAEALALLGEVVLAQGDVRTARDLLERALLIAPGYRFALDVEAQLKAVTRR